ncbi:protein NLRC3-like isoform X1 [Dysidea avara]|uniref:protein NLRC3-like isoform X1 n=1 Tax=Dysidea avara TaxID=196820 RepID=UPI0033218A40
MAEGRTVNCSPEYHKRKPKMKELIRYSTKISKCWKNVALELDLSEDKVDTIDLDGSTVEDKCYNMFRTWLRISDNPEPCWCRVVNAFELAGIPSVAKEVKEAYLVPSGYFPGEYNLDNGPSRSSFSSADNSKPSLEDLEKYLTSNYAIHWRIIGWYMKVDDQQIAAIEKEHHGDPNKCCNAVLCRGFQAGEGISWEQVIQCIFNIHTFWGDNQVSNPEKLLHESTELPPIIGTLGEYYHDLYKEMRCVPENAEWPPNQFKLRVSVALIHYKGGRTQKELLEIAKRYEKGAFAVDDMVSSNPPAKRQRFDDHVLKVTKDITDIFTADSADHASNLTCKPPKHVLIEGAPGIGKTVLAKEIAFLWANNALLNEITVLFLFFLRDPRLWEITTVTQLIQYLTIGSTLDDDEVNKCALALLHCKGFQIGFVFDGFDEYPRQNNNQFIIDLISGKIFPKSVVVCTSRPTATLFFHDIADKRIEILGFAREERKRYIALSLPDSPQKRDELDKYLKENPIIDNLCFIPLHLAILVYLFQQGSLPETLTELNESFIVHTIYRNMERHGMNIFGIVNGVRDLPIQVFNIICKLSQLAYVGLKDRRLVFTTDEIKQTCPEIFCQSHAINGFGLLQAVQHYPQTGAGSTTSFNFVHFTMQEFLAAFHVSRLSDDEQSALLNKTFWGGYFEYMWVMYVGIIGMNSSVFENFIASYKIQTNSDIAFNFQEDKVKCLHLFQCYAEAKSKEIPKMITSIFADGNIIFNNASFFHHNFLSVISFMSKSNLQLKSFGLDCCIIDRESLCSLKQFIIDNAAKVSTLQYVNLQGVLTSPWGVFCAAIKHTLVDSLMLCGGSEPRELEDYNIELRNSLQGNNTLKSLTLCDFKSFDLHPVRNAIIETMNLVSALNISTRTIVVEEINVAKKVLTSTSHPKLLSGVLTVNVLHNEMSKCTPELLDLSGQTSMTYQICYVAFGVLNNITVKMLDVSSCEMTDEGASLIKDCLHNNSTMIELNISKNQISGLVIGEIIKIKSSLFKLNVSQNNIGSHGAKHIGDAIKVNNTLQELEMFYNQIGTKGACHIAEGLLVNHSIQKLDVSINEIHDDGAIAICSCLRNNETLQFLNISWNKVTDKGAEEIAQLIRQFVKLRVLGMSGNRITSEGLVCFLDKIQTNSSLMTLFVRYNNVTKSGLVEISQCIKKHELSLAVYTTWNDVVMYHKQVVIKSSYHGYNLNPNSDPTDISKYADGYVWLIEYLEDKDYAMLLLSTCLKDNSTLLELNLSKLEVTTEGARQIAAALKVNKTLQKLDISSHYIHNDGAIAI